jgi:DNA polymerase
MYFSLLTPDLCAHWDTREMRFTPGVTSEAAASPDDIESLWLTYYRSTFNPARIKINAMVKEMPRRHWPTLPETALIPDLLAEAPERLELMAKYSKARADSAAPFVPESRDLPVLAEAATTCTGCPLHEPATQVVFGRGPRDAELMFVGEQPGDQEDLAGEPFIGPAGQLLNEILEDVAIDRDRVYVTNAVKHFKFEMRGKRRIHKKPGIREANACVPWLEAEVEAVQPKVIVALGATAARVLFGNTFKITQQRGEVMETRWAKSSLATYHPSALLRVPDPQAAAAMREAMIEDLKAAAELIAA